MASSDLHEVYVPREAIDAAFKVMSGAASPEEVVKLEQRWSPRVWRAALRRVVTRVNDEVMRSGL